MKTKHLITLLLALLIIPLLTACGGGASSQAVVEAAINTSNLPTTINAQTVATIKDREDVVVFDVREQWEYDEGHIPGVTLIPMNEVPNRLAEIPTDKTVIVTCRSGNRSSQITNYLLANGYTNVHNMAGGILAWQEAGYQVER
jgi:phage shock protein E